MDPCFILAIVLAQAPKKVSSNPVANGGDDGGMACAMMFGAVSLFLVILLGLQDLWSNRKRRRRNQDPESAVRLDPESIAAPVRRGSATPEPVWNDFVPVPPALGMLLSFAAALCVPFIRGLRRADEILAAMLGCVFVFALFMHAEVTRLPEFRPRLQGVAKVDPRTVTRPCRRLSRTGHGRHATEWVWVGSFCLLAILAIVALVPFAPSLVEGLCGVTLRREDADARFVLSMFVLFVGLLCATPLVDRMVDRHVDRQLARRRAT